MAKAKATKRLTVGRAVPLRGAPPKPELAVGTLVPGGAVVELASDIKSEMLYFTRLAAAKACPGRTECTYEHPRDVRTLCDHHRAQALLVKLGLA